MISYMDELVSRAQPYLREVTPRSLQEFDPNCAYYGPCRERSKMRPRLSSCKECKQTRLRNPFAVPPELACNHCGFCHFPQPVCLFLTKPSSRVAG